jgi:hypothetical protein
MSTIKWMSEEHPRISPEGEAGIAIDSIGGTSEDSHTSACCGLERRVRRSFVDTNLVARGNGE